MSRARRSPGRRASAVPDREERGAATVVGLVLLGALAVVTLASVVLGRILVDQRRAAAAADLAALAGAAAVQRGGDGCTAARATAADNGAGLERCRVEGEEVRVTTRLPSPSLLGRVVVLRAVARAGPVRARHTGVAQPAPSRASRRDTAPALSRGEFPLPHLGDWTQEGQPLSHRQEVIAA